MKSGIILALAFALLASVLLSGCAQSPPPGPLLNVSSPGNGSKGFVHEHADFAILVNGQMLNLSDSIFMTEIEPGANASCGSNGSVVHLHDNDGGVVHKHAPGITWGYFFSTLGMSINSTCLTLYNGSRYCTGPADHVPAFLSKSEAAALSKQLTFIVNGAVVPDLAPMEIMQGQKVLILYGPQDNGLLDTSLNQIPDRARLQSRGEGCGLEGATGPESPAPPSSYVFSSSAFSTAYFAAAIKLEANQSLNSSDFDALYAAASGAPPAAIYDIHAARWLTEHNMSEHADHALSFAYQLAVKNTSIACMPHEAEHIMYYLSANDTDMAGPAILRLQYAVLPAYLPKIEQGANVSAKYLAAKGEMPEVLRQVRALSAAAAAGDYYGPSARASLDFLQTLPC